MNAITSLQNRRIKDAIKLNKRRNRDQQKLTIVEGLREVHRALVSGIVPTEAYVCPSLVKGADARADVELLRQFEKKQLTHLFEVTPDIYGKLAYREESGGIVLVIPYLDTSLASLPLGKPPFLVVIEGVEKPGNLGAILRTADAAGVDGVIVCNPAAHPSGYPLDVSTHNEQPSPTTRITTTDVHNPNVVRASLGTLFHVPMAETTTSKAIQWLHRQRIHTVATTPEADECYTDVDMTQPIAIVMGSEAHGLSQAWLDAAMVQTHIPMHGVADSLNLSTSTALLLYEVVRQRQGLLYGKVGP